MCVPVCFKRQIKRKTPSKRCPTCALMHLDPNEKVFVSYCPCKHVIHITQRCFSISVKHSQIGERLTLHLEYDSNYGLMNEFTKGKNLQSIDEFARYRPVWICTYKRIFPNLRHICAIIDWRWSKERNFLFDTLRSACSLYQSSYSSHAFTIVFFLPRTFCHTQQYHKQIHFICASSSCFKWIYDCFDEQRFCSVPIHSRHLFDIVLSFLLYSFACHYCYLLINVFLLYVCVCIS